VPRIPGDLILSKRDLRKIDKEMKGYLERVDKVLLEKERKYKKDELKFIEDNWGKEFLSEDITLHSIGFFVYFLKRDGVTIEDSSLASKEVIGRFFPKR